MNGREWGGSYDWPRKTVPRGKSGRRRLPGQKIVDKEIGDV
jgi:hypothetical protein